MAESTPSLPEGVKSADRAMAILEVFRQQRRALSARDLADALVIPRSSTNVLLRSLIGGGYLRYDDLNALYYPTLRVFHLGSWLVDGHLDDPALDRALRDLAARTGETVCLWARIGLQLAAMTVIEGPQAISLHVRTGVAAPLFGSTVGLAMLAALDDAAFEQMLARQEQTAAAPVDRVETLLAVAEMRQRGWCAGYDRWLPDAGAVAAALTLPGAVEPLVIGVGGPTFRVRRNEALIVGALMATLAQWRQHA
jgi:DNA-binding IclR family transcriptional regulator